MKNVRCYLLGILGFLFLFNVDGFAQNGGSAGAFLRLGVGPRGMSMSNAVSSIPEFGANGFYNPALVAGTQNLQIETSSSLMSFDRNLHSITAAFKIPPKAGVQIILMNAGVSNIDGRTLSGYPAGSFSTNDYLLQSSFGVKASEKLWIGFGLKFIFSDYHPDLPLATAFGLDAGIYYKVTSKLSLSAVVKDILLTNQWNSKDLYGGQDLTSRFNYFPTQFVFGGSYRFLENKLIVSSEFLVRVYESDYVKKQISNEFNPPTVFNQRIAAKTSQTAIQSGISYRIHERVRVAFGYTNRDLEFAESHHSFSGGFSLFLPFDLFRPSIDYAINTEPSVGTLIHTFAIRFNL